MDDLIDMKSEAYKKLDAIRTNNKSEEIAFLVQDKELAMVRHDKTLEL